MAELVALGFTNREIAGVLHVQVDTVKKHVKHALAKLGLARRTDLAVLGDRAPDGRPRLLQFADYGGLMQSKLAERLGSSSGPSAGPCLSRRTRADRGPCR